MRVYLAVAVASIGRQQLLMRLLPFAIVVALTNAPAVAVEAPTGSYSCIYIGTWGCSPEPDGICVDGGSARNLNRTTLNVGFDSRRISLNGLNGRIERQDLKDGYWVYWEVGGLGQSKLTTSMRNRKLIAHLTYSDVRGSSSSDYRCTRAN